MTALHSKWAASAAAFALISLANPSILHAQSAEDNFTQFPDGGTGWENDWQIIGSAGSASVVTGDTLKFSNSDSSYSYLTRNFAGLTLPDPSAVTGAMLGEQIGFYSIRYELDLNIHGKDVTPPGQPREGFYTDSNQIGFRMFQGTNYNLTPFVGRWVGDPDKGAGILSFLDGDNTWVLIDPAATDTSGWPTMTENPLYVSSPWNILNQANTIGVSYVFTYDVSLELASTHSDYLIDSIYDVEVIRIKDGVETDRVKLEGLKGTSDLKHSDLYDQFTQVTFQNSSPHTDILATKVLVSSQSLTVPEASTSGLAMLSLACLTFVRRRSTKAVA